MNTFRLVAFASLIAVASVAKAQWDDSYGYHSATAGESYARGAADLVRSAGEANLSNSVAAKNYTEAQSKNIENHLQYTNTYFEMRRINKEARQSEYSQSLSQEQLHRIAGEAAPKRPTASQLDPITGAINWPITLRDDRYMPETKELEDLFAVRATQRGNINASTYKEIKGNCTDLTGKLVKNVDEYTPKDYLPAKTLVQGLAYEARFPIRY